MNVVEDYVYLQMVTRPCIGTQDVNRRRSSALEHLLFNKGDSLARRRRR